MAILGLYLLAVSDGTRIIAAPAPGAVELDNSGVFSLEYPHAIVYPSL
jgi:hypothetical protein